MELMTKYQYTYFIKPFLIKENKYDKYLLKLLKDKNCKLKVFEKERDLNIYSYFLQNVRDYFFPTFNYDKEKVKKLEQIDNEMKAVIISKLHCNIFEYTLGKEIQGKIDDKNCIYFSINKIEIICLDTGICFLVIKTTLENSNYLSEVLDFNYKFKDINSEFYKLKAFNNIKIQTDKFGSMKDLSNFINEIIGVKDSFSNNKDMDIYDKRFFTYSYVCIDQNYWNESSKFEQLQDEFYKFSKVHSKSYNSSTNIESMEEDIGYPQTIDKWEYARFGFTKQSGSLFSSNIDFRNYTTLLYEYEHEYLYTLIISLYQRIYLKKISSGFKGKKDISSARKSFTKFTEEVWFGEITNSETGSLLHTSWKKVFELDETYAEIKNKYDIIYKQLGINGHNIANRIIFAALIVSLALNVVNLIMLMKIM